MALTAGTRFGPYQVAESIGSGGMGEVYRATDANLKRDVAIKVLPESFAGDAARLARFQREAEVLASLNHLNIAQIYGLERSDGATALAMELIDGPTLAERIARGPVPVEEALGIARQIADALEAAHVRGIVHRDLKPANVKITPDGVVKVLDFGIAKALDTRPMSGPRAPSLTTPAMTQAGVVLGTAQYMSPEQARGKAVDQRADIWAFGCVLYEMITGQPAFGGEDVTIVLARVLERAADLSALPRTVSAAVQQTIHLCLQKEPKKRVADIRDVRLALEGAFETPTEATDSSTSASSRARLAWMVASIAVLAAVALAVPAYRYLSEGSALLSNGASAHVELSIPPGLELFAGSGRNVAVSPDGSYVAYIGVEGGLRGIHVRQIDEFATVRLRGTENASECCAFSSDGRSLSFVTAEGTLRKLSLADGLVTPIIIAGSEFTGHAWATDDSIVFVRERALWRVASSGGEPTPIPMDEPGGGGRRISWPVILPGDGAILFASAAVGGEDWRIESLDRATGKLHTVIERGTLPLYAPSGHLVFYRDGELLAAPFDVRTQRVTGATVRILENLPPGSSDVPLVDVSAAGILVYAPLAADGRLVWVSRQGLERPVIDTPRIYQNPRLDPSGRWVVVQAGDLWLHDLTRSTFTRIVADVSRTSYPVLTPDGERLVYKTDAGLFSMDLAGSVGGQAIAGTTSDDYAGSVSPDGKYLLFVRITPETSGDIYQAALDGDSDVRPILQTPAYDGSAQLSSDGRWLVYTSNETQQMEVYLRRFPGPDQRWQVSTQGGTQPIWNRNGREIFYRDGNRMMAVGVSTEGEPVLEDPVLLFEGRYSFGTGISIPNYDVSADGQQFLMVQEDASVNQLNVVLNWSAELERLASTQ
jgi:serine/threonine protein kinase